MRVLFLADRGWDGILDLALRAQALGHQVRVFLGKYDDVKHPLGKGLVKRVPDWRDSMRWADLVILEGNTRYMGELDAWRRRGVPIVGGNDESASWEHNREIGMRVLEEAGVPLVEHQVFRDYDQAIRYVERRGEPSYCKPCSDTGNKALSAKTGVPEDPSWQLRRWKERLGRPSAPIMLQDAIDGIEMGCAVWAGPAGFAAGIEENWEEKKLHAGDLGVNTGEVGSIQRYVARSKLFDKVLRPCEEALERLGVVCNFSINCIVDGDGTGWPLEWTVRCGWPSTNLEVELLDDPIEFLLALALGEDTRVMHKLDEFVVGVGLNLPPFPHPPPDYRDVIGIPIFCDDYSGFHACEVMAGTDTPLATAGTAVAFITGNGEKVGEAQRQAYKRIEQISMPGSPFWRDDIAQRLRKELPRLQEHGFATDAEF